MSRVTAAEVTDIFDTNLTDPQIQAFIVTANRLVNHTIAENVSDADLLTEIEKYIACHLCALRDPRIVQEKIGDLSATYQGKTGMHFNATQYGQMAMSLDPTGKLAKAGKGKASLGLIDAT